MAVVWVWDRSPKTDYCESCRCPRGTLLASGQDLISHHWWERQGRSRWVVLSRWVCVSCNRLLCRSCLESCGVRCPSVSPTIVADSGALDDSHFLPSWDKQAGFVMSLPGVRQSWWLRDK